MSNKLISLVALQSFYETSTDSVDVFSNLVLDALSEAEIFSVEQIKNKISEKFEITIPPDFLRTILKRLHRNKLVSYKNIKDLTKKSILLDKDGVTRQLEIREKIRGQKREEQALLKSIMIYMGAEQDAEELEKDMQSFIRDNSYAATKILDGDEETNKNSGEEKNNRFIAYFNQAEREDPENFARLRSILLGKVISDLLLSSGVDKKASMKELNIYLDTNILLSLMGLHEDSTNKTAKDTLDLIEKLGLETKIFVFTKNELSGLLKGYINQSQNYSAYVAVDSIYARMKRKGYTAQNVTSIISDMDKFLKELGIKIDYNTTVEKVGGVRDKDFSDLSLLKEEKLFATIEHDCNAFRAIRFLRGESKNTCFLFEKSKAIFVTLDFALLRFVSQHHNNGNIPEMIAISSLTGILWLKDIELADKTYVKSFLESGIKVDIISNDVWINFIRKLNEKKQQGELSSDDISEMISWSETESILREKGEEGIDLLINENSIARMKEANASQKREKNEMQQKILENDKNYEDIRNTNSMLLEKIERFNKTVENECQEHINKKFSQWLRVLSVAVILLFILSISSIFWIWGFGFKALHIAILVMFYAVWCVVEEARTMSQKIPEKIRSWMPSNMDFMKIRLEKQNSAIERCIAKKKRNLHMSNREN